MVHAGVADRGVRPPDAVLASDFAGEIVYLVNADHPHRPPTAWGVYASLREGHPLTVRLRKEDAYEVDGRLLVFLGQAVTGQQGSRPLPWLPIAEAIRGTLSLSTPQKARRTEQNAREQADQEARRQTYEDSKDGHVRWLEAQIAEQAKEMADIKARLAAEAVRSAEHAGVAV